MELGGPEVGRGCGGRGIIHGFELLEKLGFHELPGFGRGMNRGEARLGGGDEVVVADHLMPGGNGMSFLVRAREEYPHMQRILVTGYMKPEMLLRSVNEAALFRYLLKPVSLAELMKVVIEAAKLHDQLVA